jgi:hypothetical protein
VLRAWLELSFARTMMGTDVDAAEHEELARTAIEVLDQHGDDEGVGRAWFILASTYWVRGRWDDMRWPLRAPSENGKAPFPGLFQ